MRKNEKAFIALIFIGLVLKLSLVPFGQWIMLIGIGLLANAYFSGFAGILNNETYQEAIKNRGANKASKPYQFIPPYAILIMMVGMLFDFMAWPGGDVIILSGFFIMLIGIYFVLKNTAETKSWKRAALQRMIATGVIALVFYALPSFFWFDIVYREHPQYIEATKDFYEEPENESLRERMNVEREKMENGV